MKYIRFDLRLRSMHDILASLLVYFFCSSRTLFSFVFFEPYFGCSLCFVAYGELKIKWVRRCLLEPICSRNECRSRAVRVHGTLGTCKWNKFKFERQDQNRNTNIARKKRQLRRQWQRQNTICFFSHLSIILIRCRSSVHLAPVSVYFLFMFGRAPTVHCSRRYIGFGWCTLISMLICFFRSP